MPIVGSGKSTEASSETVPVAECILALSVVTCAPSSTASSLPFSLIGDHRYAIRYTSESKVVSTFVFTGNVTSPQLIEPLIVRSPERCRETYENSIAWCGLKRQKNSMSGETFLSETLRSLSRFTSVPRRPPFESRRTEVFAWAQNAPPWMVNGESQGSAASAVVDRPAQATREETILIFIGWILSRVLGGSIGCEYRAAYRPLVPYKNGKGPARARALKDERSGRRETFGGRVLQRPASLPACAGRPGCRACRRPSDALPRSSCRAGGAAPSAGRAPHSSRRGPPRRPFPCAPPPA